MQRSRQATWKSAGVLLAAAVIVALGGASLRAQTNGTWIQTVDGLWSAPGNWASGNIADGADATANFNTLDIVEQPALPNDYTVSANLDSARTVGHLILGDTNQATPGVWQLYSGTAGTALTLAGTNPSITVNPQGPIDAAAGFRRDAATIGPSAVLAGTQGFTKLGAGVLHLSGANTITGPINVNAGTLRLTTAATNASLPLTAIVNLANGTTLESNVNLTGAGTRIFTIPSGATVNINILGGAPEMGRFDAAGANINVNFNTNATFPATFAPSGNWLTTAATANPATFNITSQGPAPVTAGVLTGGTVRLQPNRGTGRDFNGNTFATTPVVVTNAMIAARTNSGGNTFNIGSLTGDANSVLSGGNQGSFANYSIGALNTSTTFAGTIDTASSALLEATPADTGGLNLTKVGSGVLTLSGTLSYQPTGNTTVNRRGAITTVSAGTLKLTNNANIPGGIVHGIAGNVFSTVNILSGATLDVSSHSSTYSTAALQQVLGVGTVLGPYIHDEGVIRPANTITGTTPTANAVAGTINFNGNFTWSGGEVTYDISASAASGNDLINVTGLTTLTSGTITPNFLPGGPQIGGTYTVLTSSGGFSGAATNVTLNYPGRAPDPVLFISGNNLQFIATDPNTGANLVWRGDHATNPTFWDINTTNNWRNGASADVFLNSDDVTFNDTANTFTVDIQATVQPHSVVVNNPINAYTIQGASGVIGGNSTFTKTGAATLTMTTANTFTGAAAIQGGTVDVVASLGALGTGALTMSGNSKLITNNTVNGTAVTNSALIMAAGSSNNLEINGTFNSSTVLPALQGSGTANITTTTLPDVTTGNVKIVSIAGNNQTFTGNLNVGLTGERLLLRTQGAGTGLQGSAVTLGPGAELRDFATSPQTIRLGSLTGDATSILGGNTGGSGAQPKTWQIGELNTSTTFNGTVAEGVGSQTTFAPTHIVKVGTGTLTLTGANTSTGQGGTIAAGNTTVLEGILSISNTTSDYFPDAGDVFVNTGGILDLSFPGTDTIDSLFLNGVAKTTGTWGAPGSGAVHTSSLFTGLGILMITTLPGDFDGDGDVDSADLTTGPDSFNARFGNNAANNLTGVDFLTWQRNLFGSLTPTAEAASGAVPEPTGIALMLVGLLALPAARRRSR